ncbi:aspartic peptidase A1 [Stereum hirsutum FP-91666 SS1]|uniref:aspartic peptidase A1 n=1 Tax=Stereum hirsutum (strain FP-91666) TaxID=721885 RepID=UPI000440E2C0|nr:aspartic peptidase A1 [Stereum hirsutum FP-91666 SS1]EIM86445.1 aspartic peptidase A1 [Stereum hirsutum FP-91666 SS1]
MPLRRRAAVQRNATEWGDWVKAQKANLEAKYSPPGSAQRKRANGQNLLVNQNADSSYIGSIAIGTPAVAYDVILDTGSADLWLAGSTCSTGCSQIQTFDTSSSSTFNNLSTSFSITYGSGAAAGALGSDVVQMAGFEVSSQTFAVCDEISSGLLSSPASGLFGLAWQSIASSGATPFWEALYESSVLDSPLFAFQLTRYQNDTSAEALEPGGTFTLGATNSSLYTGDIEYQSIPSNEVAYWTLAMTGLSVGSTSVDLGSGSETYAAIDTGTTLVGGPTEQIAALFAGIEGSQAGTGSYEGYYLYPCETEVSVSLTFGGSSWSISPADFLLAQVSESQCIGAFFEFSSSSSAPSWIVGDTFLKNVYSVFRANPASIGFANLSSTALAANGDNDASAPSPTIGSVSASITGGTSTNSNNGSSSNAARGRFEAGMGMGVVGVVGAVVLGAVGTVML